MSDLAIPSKNDNEFDIQNKIRMIVLIVKGVMENFVCQMFLFLLLKIYNLFHVNIDWIELTKYH